MNPTCPYKAIATLKRFGHSPGEVYPSWQPYEVPVVVMTIAEGFAMVREPGKLWPYVLEEEFLKPAP